MKYYGRNKQLGKGKFSADLFAGKYHRRNRGNNNRDCRNEEKEGKIAKPDRRQPVSDGQLIRHIANH